jgi:hypothetical protein
MLADSTSVEEVVGAVAFGLGTDTCGLVVRLILGVKGYSLHKHYRSSQAAVSDRST